MWAERQHVLNRNKRDGVPTDPKFQDQWYLVRKICINTRLTACQQDMFAYKSGTSCYHLVTRLMRPTDSQQVVPTSLISSARNKLLTS